MEKYYHRTTCSICGSRNLSLVLDLGQMPLANAFLKKEELFLPEDKFPLCVYFCRDCSSLQLLDILDPEILFKHYDYLTSASKPLAEHFVWMGKELAEEFVSSQKDLVVEIGGNDGVLLEAIKEKCRVLNIDPAENVAEISRRKGIETISCFFSEGAAEKILSEHGNAKVVVANNVMAHTENLKGIFSGVKKLIGEDGVFVFEVHWVGNLIGEGGFDQICHEHIFYHSLTVLKHLAESIGLKIFDIKLVPIHGQSMRVFAAKNFEIRSSVDEFLAKEKNLGLDKEETFLAFAQKISDNKKRLVDMLGQIKEEGKMIVGYGAPAKGNTLLNYFQIGHGLLDFLTDTTPLKQGLYSPGMHIPVVSPDRIDEKRPDYFLLLAWNYADVILAKEQKMIEKGSKFIIPVPEAKIL